jgi:hypothetical protein
MSRIRSGLALAGLLLALAAPLRAQSIPSPYRYIERGQEAGPIVGHLSPDRGRFGFGPGPAVAYGGRYGVELTGPLALEGVVTALRTTRDVINPARQEGDRDTGQDADVALVILEARLRFALTGRRTWNGLQPYVMTGGGVVFDAEGLQAADVTQLEERDRFDFGTRFTGSFGGGVRWIVNDRVTLRTEGLLNLWRLNTPAGYQDPERGFEAVPDSEWVSTRGVTVALTWRW